MVTDGSSATSTSWMARAHARQGCILPDNAPDKWHRAVKLQDIHAEGKNNQSGMQCADCHFEGDSHGNGKLYGEVRNAIQIRCEDCHGTYTKFATLKASGNAGDRQRKAS